MSDEITTIFGIFEKLQRGVDKYPQRAQEVGGSYLFKITGKESGCFFVNLKENPSVLLQKGEEGEVGESKAECTITARDRDFLKVYKGVLPGFKAVLSGKLKVSGNITLATKLGDLFDQIRDQKNHPSS